MEVKAKLIFSGVADYWHGCGRRWDPGAGCVFAWYGPENDIGELVGKWLDDYLYSGECESIQASGGEVREALMEMVGKGEDLQLPFDPDAPSDDDCDSLMAVVLIEECETVPT